MQRWAKEELPYQITPFVPPPRTNQRDVRYSLPTSPVSTSPSPTHIYPVDSKFASPSSYETKMATKQSLASVSGIIISSTNLWLFRTRPRCLFTSSVDATSIPGRLSYEQYSHSYNLLTAANPVQAISEYNGTALFNVSVPKSTSTD